MEDHSQPLSEVTSVEVTSLVDAGGSPDNAPRKKTGNAARRPRTSRAKTPAPALGEPPVLDAAPGAQAETQAPKKPARRRTGAAAKSRGTLPALEPENSSGAQSSDPLQDAAPHSSPAPALSESQVPALRETGMLVSLPREASEGQRDQNSEEPAAPARRRRRRGGRGRKKHPQSASFEQGQDSGLEQTHEQPLTQGQGGPETSPALSASGQAATAIALGPHPEGDRDNGENRTGQPRNRQARPAGRRRAGSSGAAPLAQSQDGPHAQAPEHETIPLSADAPLLLLDAAMPVNEPVPVVNSLEQERGNRSRRRGGRGRGPAQGATAEPLQEAAAPQAAARPRTDAKGRKLLVTVLPDDQVEVVILENGKVREYYIEMMHQAKIRGNIYKGVVSNIDTNLQAAFINYGAGKNGFLQIDEVHPEYYLNPVSAAKGHKYPPIQKVMKAGQEVLVQVGKEPTGNKGAFLTTWVSLAGRFLVLTPGQEQIGISRKVEDGEERSRLRELIQGLNPGEGLGAIVRTVSAGVNKTTMQKDLSFLKRLWRDIRKKAMQEKAPALIYQEPGLAARSVRDYLTDDVTEVWVDDEATAASMREMVSLLFSRKTDLVKLHTDTRRTLLERFDALEQIEQIHAREVNLPSGGRLVFDQTEALMAIDINSGKSGGNAKTNFETMAFRTNMEAAEVIPQQLRLRDIGGQVVIDFIEMRDQNQVREVEKTLRNSMKSDRARHDIGRMSAFGLLQIVRQRTGSSAISISMEPCPFCQGTGTRRNMEWQAVQALRDLHRKMRDAHDSGQTGLVYTVDTELAWYMLNHKRERLTVLEKELNVQLEIRPARSV